MLYFFYNKCSTLKFETGGNRVHNIGGKSIRFLLASVWCLFLSLNVSFTASILVPGIKVRDVIVPIYSSQSSDPIALLRIDSLVRDNRRLGFFKVSILPIVVVQGVKLEVLQPQLVDDLLQNLPKHLKSVTGGMPLEIRDFKVMMKDETLPRLEAKRFKPARAEESVLAELQDVRFCTQVGELFSKSARLLPDEKGTWIYFEINKAKLSYNWKTGRLLDGYTASKEIKP
jgi:hypothetical protein